MCDYSLTALRTRPAQVGEEYVTHRFPGGTIGFASPGDCTTAVCMQADTRLRLRGIPEDLRSKYRIGPDEEVIFVRLTRGPYHDGIRFGNGVEVLLQELSPGIGATITKSLAQAIKEIKATVTA